MYGRWKGELWFHRRHMWPVLVAPLVNSSVFIDSNSLSKDGRTIHVGECALFKPTHNPRPFVGLIRRVIVDKEDNLRLSVNWLYRPVDVKLLKGALLEAAPNEVFYSFHQEEIPAASLLHPCKVAFLCKGVELPSRASSFVCRQVYDIETKRLCWLTDKNYINEQQEEVDQLLDKTRVEMYGALQAGGHSPKPLNGPNGTTQLKSNTDNLQKSKKREHGGHSSDSVKRERLSKADDADSAHLRPENLLKIEIAKITDKGSLVDFEGVEKLIQLMRPESGDKKLDLPCRVMLVDVISVTERFDCLTRFVQRRGLHVIDEWLQEVHKGKIGDGSPKGSDKSIEEFIFALLRALDRLPVNLIALQTCNIGKSVNHLRSHKNSEIQKKARSLVDTWKKRVEAEMNVVETRSGTRRGGACPNKSMLPEVSPTSSRRVSGSSDVDAKISTSQISALRSPHGKPNSSEAAVKSPESPGSVKLQAPVVPGSGSLTIKEEKSSSSSPSSECGRTGGSCKEDAPSTSGNINKNSSGVSHTTKSSTPLESTVVSVQKEMGLVKCSSVDRNSPNKGTPEGAADVSSADNINNQRLIVRLPNMGRSPAGEDASTTSGKSSLVHSEKRGKGDATPTDLCDGKGGLVDSDECKKGVVNPSGEKQGRDGENVERLTTESKDSGLVKSGKTYEASYSSINALVESCAKFSQGNSSVPMGDDVGMNLLASVAAGEMSRSGSPENKRPLTEDTSTQPVACKSEDNLEVTNGHVKMEQVSSIGQLSAKGGSQQQVSPAVSHLSVDSKAASVGCEKTGAFITQLDSSVVGLLQNGINAPEVKPAALAADASALLSSIDSKNYGKEGEEAMESNMVLSNATTSAKVGTQINYESASRSSSEKQKELNKDSELLTTSCGYDEDKKMGSHAEPSEKAKMDHDSSFLQQTSEHMQESLDKNEVSVKSPEVLVQEGKAHSNQTEVAEGDPTISMPVSETVVKLDFDLNELLPSDDGIQRDVERFSTVHIPCSLPSASSMLTGNRPVSVTVAAAAKGPFFPSENLLRGKAELGWKGSAATSAFRPAEPRKVIDVPDNRAGKQARAFLDFDLNVGVVEDATSGGGGLDLNLNACDESPEVGPLSVSYGRTSIPQLPSRSLFSGRFSNTQPGFDLNNGPCAEEVGGESLPLSRNGMQFLSNVPSMRMNNMEMGGNYSSWFPPTSAYPTAILPVPGRGEQQSYPMIPSAGSQTMLNPGTSFNPEMFRGPVLSSSPAVAYSSTSPFQFPSFPFETNFSLPSNTAYVGSSGGQLCFPTVPPQLVGPSGMVSTPYRPYVMSLPGSGSSNVGPDNRKWGSQSLDLNSGPGGADLQLPQSVADEQLKMFQQMTAGGGGGGLLKRKEPPVEGWDGSYKHHHPSWQ